MELTVILGYLLIIAAVGVFGVKEGIRLGKRPFKKWPGFELNKETCRNTTAVFYLGAMFLEPTLLDLRKMATIEYVLTVFVADYALSAIIVFLVALLCRAVIAFAKWLKFG